MKIEIIEFFGGNRIMHYKANDKVAVINLENNDLAENIQIHLKYLEDYINKTHAKILSIESHRYYLQLD